MASPAEYRDIAGGGEPPRPRVRYFAGRESLGFQGRAMLLVAITLFPVLGFVLYAAWRTYATALEGSAMQAQLLARQVAADQRDVIDRTEDLMAGIALMARGNGLPLGSECPKVLRALVARYPKYASAAVADRDGNVICLSNDFGGRLNVLDREYFQRALSRGRFVWSGPIESRSTNVRAMVGATPLMDEQDQIRGLLIFTMRLDSIERTLAATVLPDNAVISLVDGRGTLLAQHPRRDGELGATVPDLKALLAFVGGGADETTVATGLDGVQRVWAYGRLPDRPDAQVFARVGFSTAEGIAAARWLLVQGLVAVAVLLAIGITLAWIGARRLIVQPLRQLEAAAESMGAGNLSARTGLPHSGGEIAGVAAKLDELAAHGQRVNRALRTLSAGNRTLLRERDEHGLLAAMCRVAVEQGGYAAAYVCYPRNDEQKSIEVAAHWGNDGGFITSHNLTWGDAPTGNGSVARCVRSGERVIVRSIAKDAAIGPWQKAAAAQGFSGVISLPLRVQSALVGTFTLMARDEGAFDEQEVDLLDEMAADLSFGIEVIRAEGRRKQAEQIAQRALTHDPVIDLPNRAWFVRRVMDCIERGRANHEPVAVIDVHLGRLEDIEDSFGHERGNEVLRQVAERLRRLPGADDNLGRIPIEDFGIVLCAYDADAAQRTAQAVRDVLNEPVRLGEARIDVQASVGISMYPGHGDEAEVLVRRASIAAREAFRKDLPHAMYSGAMARENPARLSLAAELRTAIETRQLVLHFQPKVALDGGVQGCEALVRWQHPERGMIPPLEFIALAEEIGLIRPLTYQIIDLAIRQLHAWQKAGINVPIAVNLSARNLYDSNLLNALDGMFSTWNVPRSLLHFEITEGALVDDPAAAKKTLEALSAEGGQIYVDDFGTGYSSLSYLVSLPVHSLKIDRSFIRAMTRSEEARSLVASIISMSHALKLRVVAEGVETESDATLLAELGCDEAQGYLFSRPLSAEAFAAFYRSEAKG
ncbi:MAG TPA: EAL domain-containing protein [Burkholderiales bacterium]|nr:EAL domain-containing protein [Burkholderiales bacterium]